MSKLPSAREVRDVLLHVEIGEFSVRYNMLAGQQNCRFKWQVRGPLVGVVREVLDEFATYREAVSDARRREKKRVLNARTHSISPKPSSKPSTRSRPAPTPER